MIVNDIMGPVIGAVIGYFTNYIAVKMLFFPRKEVRIGNCVLPFTPGAIPKGKKRLARAVGDVIGNTLVTREEIEKKLMSPEVQKQLREIIMLYLDRSVKEDLMGLSSCSEAVYEKRKDWMSDRIARSAADSLAEVDFQTFAVEKGVDIVRARINNPIIAMFLSDSLLASILSGAVKEVQKLVEEKGYDYIKEIVDRKLAGIEDRTIRELLDKEKKPQVSLSETPGEEQPAEEEKKTAFGDEEEKTADNPGKEAEAEKEAVVKADTGEVLSETLVVGEGSEGAFSQTPAIADETDLPEDVIQETINSMLRTYIPKIVETVNIRQIAEQKIDDMDVAELEKLVLKVMKKELNMIVNLGALIGFLLGLVNLLF